MRSERLVHVLQIGDALLSVPRLNLRGKVRAAEKVFG
jgi:hypothetical protein